MHSEDIVWRVFVSVAQKVMTHEFLEADPELVSTF